MLPEIRTLFLLLVLALAFKLLLISGITGRRIPPLILESSSPRLALLLKKPMRLEDVSTYDLDQIPGISSVLARKIILRKREILQMDRTQALKALLSIKGIGKKKSKTILEKISLPSDKIP